MNMFQQGALVHGHSDTRWKLSYQPLFEKVQPLLDVPNEVKIPDIIGTKYESQIRFKQRLSSDRILLLKEVIATSPSVKTGYLMDLICENILPLPQADSHHSPGVVILVDVGYKWFAKPGLPRLDLDGVTKIEFAPNSLQMKLLTNMDIYDSFSLSQKLQYMKRLVVIDAFAGSAVSEFGNFDTLLENLKDILFNFDNYLNSSIDDLSDPLKFILIDNMDMLEWDLKNSASPHSKLKTLYELLWKLRIAMHCDVYVARMEPEAKRNRQLNQIPTLADLIRSL